MRVCHYVSSVHVLSCSCALVICLERPEILQYLSHFHLGAALEARSKAYVRMLIGAGRLIPQTCFVSSRKAFQIQRSYPSSRSGMFHLGLLSLHAYIGKGRRADDSK